MATSRDARWALLIHQIPPKPDYFRVKIWRRLQRIGAVAVKNSVYVLPCNDAATEDFQWLCREIAEGGGDASVCHASFVDGLTDAQVESLFRAARDADYRHITEVARRLLGRDGRGSSTERASQASAELGRLRKRLNEITAIDFFAAPARRTAETAPPRPEAGPPPSRDRGKPLKQAVP